MPRIRSIKPDFWTDEKIAQEPEPIMLTFIGIWNFADDYGVVKGSPILLKSFIYPYKEKLRIDAFSTWLNRLVELDALIPFTYRGEGFYYIRTFREHQKVEKPSKARNCPEDELLLILERAGYSQVESGEFIQSGNSRVIVGEYSPPDKEGEKEKEMDKERDIGGGGEFHPPSPNEKLLKKIIPHLFSESKIFDKTIFSSALINTQYENANVEYYWEIMNNWSNSKQAKKSDWLAAARNWMAKDMTEGKFISKNFKPNGTAKTKQPTGANVDTGSILSRINSMSD